MRFGCSIVEEIPLNGEFCRELFEEGYSFHPFYTSLLRAKSAGLLMNVNTELVSKESC